MSIDPPDAYTPIAAIDRAYEVCVPLFVTIELTLICNLRCVHCYNFDRSTPTPKTTLDNELTPQEIYALIDDLAEAGGLEISFSGGEALLHPHLEDFVRHARKHQFAVRIKSNGMLLTPERAERLSEAGVYAIDISLYGADAQTHDAFTTVKGSFDRTLRGIQAATASGVRVSLSFCLTQSNASQIERMVTMAKELGCTYSLDPQITARYDGTDSSLAHRVDQDTLDALYRGPLKSALGPVSCHSDRDMQCSCARTVAGISSTGIVYPCIGAPIPSGNLREQSFKDIWAHSKEFKRIRGLILSDYTVCQTCPDRPFCRRSSGVAYNNTGDYTGPEEWTCMEAAVIHRIYDDQQNDPALVEVGTDAPFGSLGKFSNP
jgi:radical SAM protein with 4Fe4S-binding SPASM domain